MTDWNGDAWPLELRYLAATDGDQAFTTTAGPAAGRKHNAGRFAELQQRCKRAVPGESSIAALEANRAWRRRGG
jgi:hypothetical protein